MAKSRKNRKKKKSRNRTPFWDSPSKNIESFHIIDSSSENVTIPLGLTKKQLLKEREFLFTPIGDIPFHSEKHLSTIKNPLLLVKMLQVEESNQEDENYADIIQQLLEEFPEEPFLQIERTGLYLEQGKKDKYIASAKEGFEKYKGSPLIDARYYKVLYLEKNPKMEEVYQELFGEEMNIAKLYPNEIAFGQIELQLFYTNIIDRALLHKDYEKAKKIIKVCQIFINPNTVKLYQAKIKYTEFPSAKRIAILKGVMILLLVLGIIISIVYSIISLFQYFFN